MPSTELLHDDDGNGRQLRDLGRKGRRSREDSVNGGGGPSTSIPRVTAGEAGGWHGGLPLVRRHRGDVTRPLGSDFDLDQAAGIKQPEQRLHCLCSGRGIPADQSVVAIIDRADPHTVVRTATLATPFTTGTALAVPIVPVPATWTTLARAVVAMNPNDVAAQSVRWLSHVRRDGADHRRGRRQKNHCSQGFDHSNHLSLPRVIAHTATSTLRSQGRFPYWPGRSGQ